MGARKKSEDGEDAIPRAKKPNNFWAPFNTWWREHHERTGNRATVVEMREWYAQNAHAVWPADVMPSVEDMLKIAKGLRTIKQVQAYFRSYRKNLKTRKEGDPVSPEGGCRRARRHAAATRAVGAAAAGSFLVAMQQAAQQFQLHHQHPSVAATGADHVAPKQEPSQPVCTEQQQLPFLEWGFASEAAAAAAMEEAMEAASDADTLSDTEADAAAGGSFSGAGHPASSGMGPSPMDGVQQCRSAGRPLVTTAMNAAGGCGGVGGAGGGTGGGGGGGGAARGAAGCTSGATAAAPPGGTVMPALHPPYEAGWGPPGAPQPHLPYLQPAFAHRRIVKAVRTSAGGGAPGAAVPAAPLRQPPEGVGCGAAPAGAAASAAAAAAASAAAAAAAAAAKAAVFNTVSSGSGAAAVTCRRTRIHTSAGGVWKQEVVEQLEVGVSPGSPLPYGLPLPSYQPPYTQGQDDGAGGAFSGPSSFAAAETPPGSVWLGRSTAGGGADGNCTAATVPAAAAVATTGGADGPGGGMVHAPPRKQLRCGDRGMVSLGGAEGCGGGVGGGGGLAFGAAPSGAAAAGQLMPGPGPAPVSADSLQFPPPRRVVQSYGGTPALGAGGLPLRHKLPHGSAALALSDGGAVYGGGGGGAQMPPASAHPHHTHAPLPPFRAAASSYGGVAPTTWPPHHHPHATAAPPHHHHHHPVYPPYHTYGYRHPHLGYPPLPPYGYHPQPSYPSGYHMTMSYNPYGMYSSYGQYYPEVPASAPGTGSMAPDGRSTTDARGPSLTGQLSADNAPPDMHRHHYHHHPHQHQQPPPPLQRSQQAQQEQHEDEVQRQGAMQEGTLPSAADMAPAAVPYGQQPPQQQPPPPPHVQQPHPQQHRLQPLQLAELPPQLPSGLLPGDRAESLGDPSDLGGLSGLSALGLAGSDTEDGDEEAASGAHQQHHQQQQPGQLGQAGGHGRLAAAKPARRQLSSAPQQQQQIGGPRGAKAFDAECDLSSPSAAAAAAVMRHAGASAAAAAAAVGMPVGEEQERTTAAQQQQQQRQAALRTQSQPVEHPQAELLQRLPEPPRCEGRATAAATCGDGCSGASPPGQPPMASSVSTPPDATCAVAVMPHSSAAYSSAGAARPAEPLPPPVDHAHSNHHHDRQAPPGFGGGDVGSVVRLASHPPGQQEAARRSCGSGTTSSDYFPTSSDGGGTDAAVNLYYKTPKMSGKPLGLALLPDDMSMHGLPHPSVPPSTDSINRHLDSLVATGGAIFAPPPLLLHSCMSSDAAGGGGGGGGAGISKGRGVVGGGGGGPVPMTIHVLQEEVLVMPHLAGMGMAPLGVGDMADLHSPTGSLNLGLLEQPMEDGGELGMWGA